MSPRSRTAGPTVLDALSLLAEVADELLVRTVRDTHLAVLDRIHGRCRVHRGIATARSTAGLAGGLTRLPAGRSTGPAATGRGAAARGRRPRPLRQLGGQRADRRPAAAGAAAAGDPDGGARCTARDVALEPDGAGGGVPGRDRPGRGVPARPVRERVLLGPRTATAPARRTPRRWPSAGWTPVMLRANTGLALRENGAALAALLQRLVEAWPVAVTRIALVGHSMGGLVMRAAGAVASDGRRAVDRAGHRRGHARHAAPRRADRLGRRPRQPGAGRLPETAAFGRILDRRSRRRARPRRGLAEDVPPLPHARYHLVAATLTGSPRHPVGHVVGDLLVRPRRRRTAATGAARACSPAPTCCTSAAPTTSGCSTTPRCTRALRAGWPDR